MPEQIQSKLIEEELKQSYIDYAMSVITARALPDVKDGLKPVHRRILYAMHRLNLLHNRPFRKSAYIVGRVLASYHPHGDISVYDALVRMAQPFSLLHPLVDGQGNFGGQGGETAAAMRYCITGDSLILTDKGLLYIGDISDKKETKLNMEILSYQGKRNITSKFFNSGKQDIIKIKTNLGYEIKGSFNHPLLCWILDRNGKPKIEWKLLEDIRKKDIILLSRKSLFSKHDLNLKNFYPKGLKRTFDIGLPPKMNKDLAFLLGALVSEGSFHQNKILFSNSDMQFYNYVKSIIYEQFHGIKVYEQKISGNCLELCIYHKKVVEFLKNIGLKELKSHGKEIPFSVLQSSKKSVSEFLKGLFEGDGSVSFKVDKRHNGKSMELTYDSKSKSLIKQLKIILLNFGIATSHPYTDKRCQCYKLKLTGNNAIKNFKDRIGFFSERKNILLSNISSINPYRMSKNDFIPYLSNYLKNKYNNSFLKHYNVDRYNNLEKNYNKLKTYLDSEDKKLVDFLLNNRFLFDRVIEKINLPKENVYSIRVNSPCHSFISNGFISHNTEARMSKLAEELLKDIEKNTVNFIPNYDNSTKEPIVLPTKIPNLLINGSSGIAVGMATNIPPHNLIEISNACIKLIDNPELSLNELMKYVNGPDFPTGGIICGKAGIKRAYETGQGKITVKSKTEIEESEKRNRIIITEIPYMLNKSLLIVAIANKVQDQVIEGISDIRDESDRKGLRIVIELKNNIDANVVLNQLLKNTDLKVSFGINMLSLVDGMPKVLGLKEMLNYFILHRKDVVVRRTKFDLEKAQLRAHILLGLKVALANIDNVVKTIKASKDVEVAKNLLIERFKLSEKQSEAILEMRLQRLTSLETNKIIEEHVELLKKIKEYKEILASNEKIFNIIKSELEEIKNLYGVNRKTEITDELIILEDEDLIPEEDVVVTVTHSGYIKRIPITTYKAQRRGGKGVIGTDTKEEDFVENLFITSTHNYLLFFTNKGKLHWLKAYDVPEGSRYSGGKAIVNVLKLEEGEKITTLIPIKDFSKGYLVMVTKNGLIKKVQLKLFSNPRSSGIRCVNLREKDELVNAIWTDGYQKLILASSDGMAVKFDEIGIRPMGRTAAGVRAMRLKGNSKIIGLSIARDDLTLLTVTENGYGKRTIISDYRLIKRGGSGVINIKTSVRNGKVVAIQTVNDNDEVFFITAKGIMLRTKVKNINTIGRATQGVRLIKLNTGDKFNSLAKVINDEE